MAFRNPFAAHRSVGIPLTGQTWRDHDVDGDDLAGMIFQDCVFERVRFRGVNLWQTTFVGCRIEDCEFESCTLRQTSWVDCNGAGMTVTQGELAEAVVTRSRLARVRVRQQGRQVTLSETEIEQLVFEEQGGIQQTLTISECEFGELIAENARWTDGSSVGMSFAPCRLGGARLERCSFIRADGRGADLSTVAFHMCNLYRSRFDEARFREAEGAIFAECALESADFEEASIVRCMFAKAEARNARFDRARMAGVLFPGADLRGASFAGAHAPNSVWAEAVLDGANLAGLQAPASVFRNASLRDADVAGADLSDADLHGVEGDLIGANLKGARGTIEWRAKLEREMAQDPAPAQGPAADS